MDKETALALSKHLLPDISGPLSGKNNACCAKLREVLSSRLSKSAVEFQFVIPCESDTLDNFPFNELYEDELFKVYRLAVDYYKEDYEKRVRGKSTMPEMSIFQSAVYFLSVEGVSNSTHLLDDENIYDILTGDEYGMEDREDEELEDIVSVAKYLYALVEKMPVKPEHLKSIDFSVKDYVNVILKRMASYHGISKEAILNSLDVFGRYFNAESIELNHACEEAFVYLWSFFSTDLGRFLRYRAVHTENTPVLEALDRCVSVLKYPFGKGEYYGATSFSLTDKEYAALYCSADHDEFSLNPTYLLAKEIFHVLYEEVGFDA